MQHQDWLTILVQPMLSKRELNGDSNYVVYSQLIKAMAKVRPRWHFYIIFPDANSGYVYENDGFFRQSNVTRIPQRISTRKFGNAVSYDATWYDQLLRRVGFDVIWCNLVEVAGHLKWAGTPSYEIGGRPWIVNAHNYVIHKTLPYVFDTMEATAIQQLAGALQADRNVFNSQHCKWMLLDNAAQYLSGEMVKRIESTARIINYGTLEPSLQYQETNNEVPVIAYNHRLQAYKNWQTTFDLLDTLYRDGVKFRLRYMNNVAEHLANIRKWPWIETKLCATRAEYLSALRGCDLNITNSQHETFCIAAIESMALGQPLIAPNGVTFPEITGAKETGYPYLFQKKSEQLVHMRKLLTERAERLKWGRILSDYVTKNFNSTLWAERYADLFTESLAVKLNPSDDSMDALKKLVKRNRGATLEALLGHAFSVVVNGRQPFGSQSLTATKLARCLRRIDCKITVEAGQQRVS